VLSAEASASQATIRLISCTSRFVSRVLVLFARNWEILALRHGCCETVTLGGREAAISVGRRVNGRRERKERA